MTKPQQLKYNNLMVNLTNDFDGQIKLRYFNDMLVFNSNKKLYKLFGKPIKNALSKSQLYFYLTGLIKSRLSKEQFTNWVSALKDITLITEFK